jgi:hypothetical protein
VRIDPRTVLVARTGVLLPDPRDAQIARLTEQVRVAREGLKSIASDADSTRMAREANQTLTRMETTDGQ